MPGGLFKNQIWRVHVFFHLSTLYRSMCASIYVLMVRYLMGLQTHSICDESGIVTWCESNSILSFYAELFLSLYFILVSVFLLVFFCPRLTHPTPKHSLISSVEQERHLVTISVTHSPLSIKKNPKKSNVWYNTTFLFLHTPFLSKQPISFPLQQFCSRLYEICRIHSFYIFFISTICCQSFKKVMFLALFKTTCVLSHFGSVELSMLFNPFLTHCVIKGSW